MSYDVEINELEKMYISNKIEYLKNAADKDE